MHLNRTVRKGPFVASTDLILGLEEQLLKPSLPGCALRDYETACFSTVRPARDQDVSAFDVLSALLRA